MKLPQTPQPTFAPNDPHQRPIWDETSWSQSLHLDPYSGDRLVRRPPETWKRDDFYRLVPHKLWSPDFKFVPSRFGYTYEIDMQLPETWRKIDYDPNDYHAPGPFGPPGPPPPYTPGPRGPPPPPGSSGPSSSSPGSSSSTGVSGVPNRTSSSQSSSGQNRSASKPPPQNEQLMQLLLSRRQQRYRNRCLNHQLQPMSLVFNRWTWQ